MGSFDPSEIGAFAREHAGRFDLFSFEEPFMQSADVDTVAREGTPAKTVAYLFPEMPAETNVAHWRHLYGADHAICPPCAARGLVTIPAFATSGGKSFRPSINGIPPLYVLPLGDTLFEGLAQSLIASGYRPKAAANDGSDTPSWVGERVVPKGKEVGEVGYMQSLTFPARRVRLYPVREPGSCTRCGCFSDVRVREMLFEMGLSRPRGSPAWLDPFVAYAIRGDRPPSPVRPQRGKALWREYGTLFLADSGATDAVKLPEVVQQLAGLRARDGGGSPITRIRCVGMRTRQAKVFEWVDDSLDVPFGLLAEPHSARRVRLGIGHAEAGAQELDRVFRQSFVQRKRYAPLRTQMMASYWTRLGSQFHSFVLTAGDKAKVDAALDAWDDQVVSAARSVFLEAAESIGERGKDLGKITLAIQTCDRILNKRREEWMA